ncbi:MAG: hypothetical protein ACR2PX_04645 [Endozoicomonas sp.]|uniref:hypothetical protein n=1 Tax=Endozoicomonas sp. TaxID=1892382 RepID=UPI003D9B4C88
MSLAERVDALEARQSEFDGIVLGVERSIDLLITELRQFQSKTGVRFDELESRFDYQNKRVSHIEIKLAEHDECFRQIDSKLVEHDERFRQLSSKLIQHDTRFDEQDRAIKVLQSDVSTLKSDVSTLKSDMLEVKQMLATVLERLS